MKTNQLGYGWKKSVGSVLLSMGVLGGLGGIDKTNLSGEGTVNALIGASVLGGIGSYLIYKEKKQKGGKQIGSGSINKYMLGHMRKLIKKHKIQLGSGSITKKKLESIIGQHKDKLLHVSDIFGDDWKVKGVKLIKALKQVKDFHDSQDGGNIFKKLGHASKEAFSHVKKGVNKGFIEIKKFAEGKTKFKPSQLLNYLSGAVAIAGSASALIPGLNLISVPVASATSLGLSGVSRIAAQSGRGNQIAAGLKLPGEWLGGAKIPKKWADFLKGKTDLSSKILKVMTTGVMTGKGDQRGGMMTKKELASHLGVALTVMGATGYGFYKYLIKNPNVAFKLVQKGVNLKYGGSINLSGQPHQTASGVSLPGQGGGKLKKVKKKRAPSAYNLHIKSELSKLKNSHPNITHKERFKMAAKSYKKA